MSRASDLTRVKLAFASGADEVNREFLRRFDATPPELPLFVVSEFQPPKGEWIPWHVFRGVGANMQAIRFALGGAQVEIAAFPLLDHPPLRGMKVAALRCGARRVLAYDEKFHAISCSLAGLPALTGYAARSVRGSLKWQLSPEGRARKWLQWLKHPQKAEIPFLARRAQLYGSVASRFRPRRAEHSMRLEGIVEHGVSVIIPSRDGRELLERLFPTLLPQLVSGEVIVSDNGSADGTDEWLARVHPQVRVIRTATTLSFARAVNLGILQARFSHILLLNNDMVLETGCLDAFEKAFRQVPDLFCATAQIFFPEGARREETGKAVWRKAEALDFPVRCDDPISGEDLTWVLYGSGGCSLFDTAKLRSLGGVAEVYDPAYVEDLDLGYRGWKHGWPTVYCAKARVEHRHRATTARFFTGEQLRYFVERNYLRFLIHAVGSPGLFEKLWHEAIRRLQLLAMQGDAAALETLRSIPRITALGEPAAGPFTEEAILAIGSGDIAVFPGRGKTNHPIVIASPYLPYPLSHGGAVRMFNLMRECNRERGQVLVSFVDRMQIVPEELLEICAEVVLVRRHGTHYRKKTELPDVVEEFASESFAAVLQQTVRKWSPAIVQLEFTQMAQYAKDCHPARTVLIEHDITFDLLEQLLTVSPDAGLRQLELGQQLAKWRRFETEAWKRVHCVVAMSEKDRRIATAASRRAECLPNGVDTDRFQPPAEARERDPSAETSLLFIGSFQHLPNLLGLEWFLREVWPLLGPGFALHVIGGTRHEYYFDFYRDRVHLGLQGIDALSGIAVSGFVADVRQAYRNAHIVLAPLIASAGTNIKVLEAMAMGRAVVSTTAGVNGLEVRPGIDIAVANEPGEFARAIRDLAANPVLRQRMEDEARNTAVTKYDWSAIGQRQAELYRSLADPAPDARPIEQG